MQTELPKADEWARQVLAISNEKAFEQIALQTFALQFAHNPVYAAFCNAVGKTPQKVSNLNQIPFLPISFFKTHQVVTGSFTEETLFKSSGTTTRQSSCHFVKSVWLYHQSFLRAFEKFYGKPEEYCILGLLPSYLEQGASSLVYMVDALIKQSNHRQSGFYLYDFEKLHQALLQLEASGQKVLLFGVTYALLQFAEAYPLPLKKTTIIETGGMKGRKKEMSKPELYDALKKAFRLDEIHSEYGMTELLSQAYAVDGLYQSTPWMRVVLRDETDPFSIGHSSGAVNVIDLANIYSCAFIATDDLGRRHTDGRFELLGRMDNTDIRGCSQLAL